VAAYLAPTIRRVAPCSEATLAIRARLLEAVVRLVRRTLRVVLRHYVDSSESRRRRTIFARLNSRLAQSENSVEAGSSTRDFSHSCRTMDTNISSQVASAQIQATQLSVRNLLAAQLQAVASLVALLLEMRLAAAAALVQTTTPRPVHQPSVPTTTLEAACLAVRTRLADLVHRQEVVVVCSVVATLVEDLEPLTQPTPRIMASVPLPAEGSAPTTLKRTTVLRLFPSRLLAKRTARLRPQRNSTRLSHSSNRTRPTLWKSCE
jgi:IS1 family transposase